MSITILPLNQLAAITAALSDVQSDVTDLQAAVLDLESNPYVHPNHLGDVSSVGDGLTTISVNVVDNLKLADMAANTVKARSNATAGDPGDLAMPASTILARLATGNIVAATPTQLRTLINVEDGAAADQSAAEVPVTPVGNLASSNTQAALQELQDDIDYINLNLSTGLTYKGSYDAALNSPDLLTPVPTDIGDTYTVTAAGTFYTTALMVGDVLIAEVVNPTVEADWTIVQRNLAPASETTQGIIELASQAEVDGGVDTQRAVTPATLAGSTLATKVAGIEAGATADQDAAEVPVTPAGNLGSTNVQAALQELQGDINSLSSASHAALSLGGAPAGTTDDTLDLTGQVLTVNLATVTTDGAMAAGDKSKLDGIAAGANNYTHPDHTGDVTSTSDGATVIAANVVTNAKLVTVAANTVKVNPTAAAANPQDLTIGANTVLGRQAGNIVAAQLSTAQIANNAVDNLKLADMTANTVKARAAGTTGDPADLAMPASTILARLATGNIVPATPEDIRTLLGITTGVASESGSSFPAQPAYGNYRPFYRTDLREAYTYDPTIAGGIWISDYRLTLEYLEPGGLDDNKYYRFQDLELDAATGPAFDFPCRVMKATFNPKNPFGTGNIQEIRSGGVTRDSISIPNGLSQYIYTPATPPLIPANTRIQLYTLAGDGASDTQSVIILARTSG